MPILAYNVLMTQGKKKETNTAKRRQVQAVQIDSTDEKEVTWWPEKLVEEIKNNWPLKMRREGGFQLGRVQQGLEPDNYRPMPDIGTGVREIKLQDEDKSQYRLIYTANFQEAVYVFHVITKKKTERTSQKDKDIAKRRLSEIIEHRRKSKGK